MVPARVALGDVAVTQISADGLRGPFGGRTVAAAAAGAELDARAGRDPDARLLAERPLASVGENESHRVRPGFPSSGKPPRSVALTLDRRGEPAVLERAEEDVDAEAAAVSSGAAGVGRQLHALEQRRVLRLPDLRRREAGRALGDVDEAVRAVAAGVPALARRGGRPLGPRLAAARAGGPPDAGADVAPAAGR